MTTSGELFDRWWKVTVGEKEIEASLRVEFKAVRTLTDEPNAIEIGIYNLAPASRGYLEQALAGPKVTAVLEAGYRDQRRRGVLALGDVASIDHVRRGPDWVTKVRVLDGWRGITTARISESLGPGTTIQQALQAAIDRTRLNPGNWVRALQEGSPRVAQFSHGLTLQGRAYDQVLLLADAAGFEVSVQNGELQLLETGAAVTAEAVLLSPSTGLIESPETGAPDPKTGRIVTKMKSLLNHLITPGRAISLDGVAKKGVYRVEKVTHLGDSHGQPWYSEIEATPR